MTVELGVIADDLTGACDVAAGVTGAGVPTEVRVHSLRSTPHPDAACVVFALKSRTAPVADAVTDSVAAARTLRGWGVDRLYQKYCSTFDSTDEGNIGPVADALINVLGTTAVSIGTPATPAAARTMHRGHLFVGDRLLNESSLASHPLTPMRDSDMVRVLGRQTPRRVASIGIEDVRLGAPAVVRRIHELRSDGVSHILVDAVADVDLDVLAAAVRAEPDLLLAGAAGFACALARQIAPGAGASVHSAPVPGGCLIVSGSGSERTRAQVAAHTGPRLQIDVARLVDDADTVVRHARDMIAAGGIPLITATADPEEVKRSQARWGTRRLATLVERTLTHIAVAGVRDLGIRRVIVAGGETSGAVAAGLGLDRLTVRAVPAPGVPWMRGADADGRQLDIAFKSGNFGQETFFVDAWD